MIREIYKYDVPMVSQSAIALPVSAELLHVGEQGGGLKLWCMVDPTNVETQPVFLFIIGTGHEVPAEATRHLGTVVVNDVPPGYVWHLFTTEGAWLKQYRS